MYLFVMLVALVSCSIMYVCFEIISKKATAQLKRKYLKALMTKDQYWYDSHSWLEGLPSQVNNHLRQVELAAGKTMAFTLYSIGYSLWSLFLSLYMAYFITAILLGAFVYLGVVGALQSDLISKFYKIESDAYLESGALAEQALDWIKTVKAFGQENLESQQYWDSVERSKAKFNSYRIKLSVVEAMVNSLSYAMSIFGLFISGLLIYNDVKSIS